MRDIVVKAEVALLRHPDTNPNLDIHAEDMRLVCECFREAVRMQDLLRQDRDALWAITNGQKP
jgi:FMN phosphatase YigB (HAD superfamily)